VKWKFDHDGPMEVLCQILQVTHPNPYDLRIPFELEAYCCDVT